MFFQNANNSVRATDGFMQAVLDDAEWQTHFVKSSEVAETRPARKVLHMIAEAALACGDPGMQFDTTINLWHTCPASGRINASNPCSEYMHLDNSACNLASLNLMKFIDDRGEFDVRAFRHAVDVMITAHPRSPRHRVSVLMEPEAGHGAGTAVLGLRAVQWGPSAPPTIGSTRG